MNSLSELVVPADTEGKLGDDAIPTEATTASMSPDDSRIAPPSGLNRKKPIHRLPSGRWQSPARPETEVELGWGVIAKGLSVSGDCALLSVGGTATDSVMEAEKLKVTGRLHGEVTAGVFEVHKGAVFKGRAVTDKAIVSGRVEGVLIAREKLSITPTGYCAGVLRYGSLKVHPGGMLSGDINGVEPDSGGCPEEFTGEGGGVCEGEGEGAGAGQARRGGAGELAGLCVAPVPPLEEGEWADAQPGALTTAMEQDMHREMLEVLEESDTRGEGSNAGLVEEEEGEDDDGGDDSGEDDDEEDQLDMMEYLKEVAVANGGKPRGSRAFKRSNTTGAAAAAGAAGRSRPTSQADQEAGNDKTHARPTSMGWGAKTTLRRMMSGAS